MRETADKPSLEDILQHAWLGRLETVMKSQVRLRNCSGPEETRQAWRLCHTVPWVGVYGRGSEKEKGISGQTGPI